MKELNEKPFSIVKLKFVVLISNSECTVISKMIIF